MAQAEELRGKAAQETHSQVLPPLSHPPLLPQLYSLLIAFMEVNSAASQAVMKMKHSLPRQPTRKYFQPLKEA